MSTKSVLGIGMKYPYFTLAFLESLPAGPWSPGRWEQENTQRSRRWELQSFRGVRLASGLRASCHLGLIAATVQVPARPGYQEHRPKIPLVLALMSPLARQGAGRE